MGEERYISITSEVSMPTTLGESVGSLRFELLSHMIGETDPFEKKRVVIRSNSKDKPNLIPAKDYRRMMACICNEEDNGASYAYIYKNLPTRCRCGHWFKLVDPDVFAENEGQNRADWLKTIGNIPEAKQAYEEALKIRENIIQMEGKLAVVAQDSPEGKKISGDMDKVKVRDLELEAILDRHYFQELD